MQVIGTYIVDFGDDDSINDLFITHGDIITDKSHDNKQVDGKLDSSGLSLFFHGKLLLKYASMPKEMVDKADNIYVIEMDYKNEARLAIKIEMQS